MNSPTAESDWWVTVPEEGAARFRWRRSADGIEAEWVNILTLRVHSNGAVHCTHAPGADPLLAKKIVGTGALAFIRALHGQPSLHGSAVARTGVAIACVGDSGAGKSTAAAELCKAGDFELLADDVVALESSEKGWRVLPTEGAHWLFVDDSAVKGPVPARARGAVPVDLGVVAWLRFEDRAARLDARRLRGIEAYSVLSSAVIRFERADDLQRRELDVLSAIASQARVYEVTRPRGCLASETAGLLADIAGEVA
jgi:hypothetical protein